MAYNGYLIKILGTTDYVMPFGYMVFQSYKGTYSVLDGDSKRNGEGRLVRTVLPHKVAHCSVDIMPLDNNELGDLMGGIQSRYTEAAEKKVTASIWVPEINGYVEEEFYVPDIEITIKKVEDGKVIYEPFTLEFIGY